MNKILIHYNSEMLEFQLKINQNEITKSISFLNKVFQIDLSSEQVNMNGQKNSRI